MTWTKNKHMTTSEINVQNLDSMICCRSFLMNDDRQQIKRCEWTLFAFSLSVFSLFRPCTSCSVPLREASPLPTGATRVEALCPPSPSSSPPHPPPLHASQSNMWARGRAGLTRIATSVTWPQMRATPLFGKSDRSRHKK